MKSSPKLIGAVVGALLLASPMAASASEHHHFWRAFHANVAPGTFATVHSPAALVSTTRTYAVAPARTWVPAAVTRPYYQQYRSVYNRPYYNGYVGGPGYGYAAAPGYGYAPGYAAAPGYGYAAAPGYASAPGYGYA
ncbi:MAG TPA: hypothetical protein VEJ86_08185, partial [Candidatus Binataceae bacterium]|nr:hypothetical protein [Candidatus Binataceae bacterium]